jgi:UDP-glucose 4-epimerase
MKKILITGANSYIGTSFESWLSQWPDQYAVDTVDMIDGTWKERDFSGYDVVFHVAGIAHVDTKRASKETQDLYYRINRDLTIETADKAKRDGVKQFIFMSSIIVYDSMSKAIDGKTLPAPNNFYGNSKLQAEEQIRLLECDTFKTVLLRPPMIYGKGSKGNYKKLSKLAQILPIFPDFNNIRSMLHIDNLCEFIKLMIDNNESGLFFPQNNEYVKTSEMVKLIAEIHGKKVMLIKIFNPLIKLLNSKVIFINKIFGNFYYEKSISVYKMDYIINDFRTSIEKSEV